MTHTHTLSSSFIWWEMNERSPGKISGRFDQSLDTYIYNRALGTRSRSK